MKAVIFDYGCVLSLPQDGAEIRKMAGLLGLGVDSFIGAYWEFRQAYDAAELTATEYWRRVAERGGVAADPASVPQLTRSDARSWARRDPAMTPWLRRLKDSGLKVALASNMPVDVKTYVVRRFGWLRRLDWLTFSCDLRVTKPDARIFQHCLGGLGVQPREALLFDDHSENVSAAASLGIAARLFCTAQEAAAELEQLCSRRLI